MQLVVRRYVPCPSPAPDEGCTVKTVELKLTSAWSGRLNTVGGTARWHGMHWDITFELLGERGLLVALNLVAVIYLLHAYVLC